MLCYHSIQTFDALVLTASVKLAIVACCICTAVSFVLVLTSEENGAGAQRASSAFQLHQQLGRLKCKLMLPACSANALLQSFTVSLLLSVASALAASAAASKCPGTK